MEDQKNVQLFEQFIKVELSLLIGEGGKSNLLREIIFSNCTIHSWYDIALLIKHHNPELTSRIDGLINLYHNN